MACLESVVNIDFRISGSLHKAMESELLAVDASDRLPSNWSLKQSRL